MVIRWMLRAGMTMRARGPGLLRSTDPGARQAQPQPYCGTRQARSVVRMRRLCDGRQQRGRVGAVVIVRSCDSHQPAELQVNVFPCVWLVEFEAMVRVVRATQVEIETAVQTLRDGELVAFPTERSMGWAPTRRIRRRCARSLPPREAGRPPVIVHLDSPRFLHRWVREVPEPANKLAERSGGATDDGFARQPTCMML